MFKLKVDLFLSLSDLTHISSRRRKYILGYINDETVMLDFENIRFKDVLCWSRRPERTLNKKVQLIVTETARAVAVKWINF
jgi:hypothetical protein